MEIASGSSSGDLAVACEGGNEGLNTLAIRVRAPNQSAARDYTFTISKAFTVSFNTDGSYIASQIRAYGALASDPGSPSRAYYYFEGWYDADSGGAAWDFGANHITADTTIYATWTECGDANLSFALSPSYQSVALTPSSATIAKGETLSIGCSDAVLSSSATVSWKWYVDGSLVSSGDSSTYSSYGYIAGAIGAHSICCALSYGGLLYSGSATVIVIEPFTVSYSGNGNTGGSAPTDGAAYAAGDAVAVEANSGGLVKSGYAFAGWATSASAEDPSFTLDAIEGGTASFAMGSSSVTLYAVWTKTSRRRPRRTPRLRAIKSMPSSRGRIPRRPTSATCSSPAGT